MNDREEDGSQKILKGVWTREVTLTFERKRGCCIFTNLREEEICTLRW